MQINQVLFYNKRKQTRNKKYIGITIKSKETSSYVAIYLSNCWQQIQIVANAACRISNHQFLASYIAS